MNPWYWAPIALAVLGSARIVYVIWYWEDVSRIGFLFAFAAMLWAAGIWIADEPASWSSPAPQPAKQCLVQQWQQHYDTALKHDVGSWVCTGWAQ